MARYAIYYMPHEQSPLSLFGCSVLGYDAVSGTDVPYPDDPVFLEPAALGWTAAPRRYGFHATLKPPFKLAVGCSIEDLMAHLAAFAADQRTFQVDLKLADLDHFIALVPIDAPPALRRLADDCVRDFDRYRAPLSAADRERRHPDRLSPSELENLDRWGYPHVFEDFRFHMTLTGPLETDARVQLEPVLRAMFERVPQTASIDAIALLRQGDDEQDRFVVQARFPFAAA
jgi:putative phosphonate metabolism protein